MRAVLDASAVLAAFLTDEGLRPRALRLLAEVNAGLLDPIVAAPFPFEIRNGLVRAARRGRFTWDRFDGVVREIESYRWPAAEAPADRDLLFLCQSLHLGWADAHWVHLAGEARVVLITTDQRLARSVPPEVAWVEWLGDRPLDGDAAED